MPKMITYAVLLVLGLAAGSVSALGTRLLMAEHGGGGHGTATTFVPTGQILAPMVFPDGRLAGYVTFDAQIEVPEGQSALVKGRLPVLLNAVNMRTYRTPLASGPDGLIPSIDGFRRVLLDAAIETYGKSVVRKVAVTQATPA